MHSLSVIVALKNPSAANQIAAQFRTRVRDVVTTHSRVELRAALAKRSADAVVVDLELCEPVELRQLCEELHGIPVVAAHRSPDEEMWMRSMDAGAVDCCHCADVEGMLRAILQNVRLVRYARAA
jgi:DNA-binding response OmpR family regulator